MINTQFSMKMLKDIIPKVKILREYLHYIDWAAFISIILLICFGATLCTAYFFPIYPDEIQVRFWLSRLPYDFPEIISGAPTCLSTFFQPRPLTMYLPGLIDWLVHGRLEGIPELRQVGFIVAFLWVAGLVFYINVRIKNILVQVENQLSFGLRALYIMGFFIAIFSIGVFPFFLVTNRNEQLILPAIVLLIAIFLISKRMGSKGHRGKEVVLIVLYFVSASLIFYGHPKGLFLTPFIIVVGWQIFSHFRSRLPFILAMVMLAMHIFQNISALKYALQCSEMPHFEAMLKSFLIDPASLFYDPRHFFDQVFQSLMQFPKYLHQIGFQEQTDIDYLPRLPLATSAKLANIFVKMNLAAAFITMMIALPCRYYRKDVMANHFVTVNLVLLALFVCALISAILNLSKNWYDAGYLYALLLIIIIFFVGENFSEMFQKTAARNLFLYLGAVALLSQAVLVQRNLPAFMAGYSGPGVSIAKYDSIKTSNDLAAASRVCNIDPVRSKKVIVDDHTYLYFQKSKWPMAVTYIGFLNDDNSIRQFFLEADSDGLVTHCESWIFNKPYIRPFVKRQGDVCCISKGDLRNSIFD